MFNSQNSPTVYTVTRLNKEIRQLLERNFASITINGEISNFVSPSSGHWYFTVKDDLAQIRAAMWRGNNQKMQFKPKNGDQVHMRARISLYEPRGDYQLIVEHMEPAGEGQLKQQFEALKMQLAAEGLFSSAFKKPLPSTINKVGIITSATGAAIKDILTVLHRRAPQLEVVIYPAQVQGANAHQQLIEKLALANARNEVDVLILGRGGGSLEDLWCFNHELLARAIYASRLPVVSAVGHEIDTTISDFVADIRAATPSAAAELVSPDQQQLFAYIEQQTQRLHHAFKHTYARLNQQALELHHRLSLCHPQNQLQQKAQKLDELQLALQQAMAQRINKARTQHAYIENRLMLRSPQTHIQHAQHRLQQLENRFSQAMKQTLKDGHNQLALYAAQLEAVSPLAVLSRGYSITKDDKGHVIKSAEAVHVGTTVTTELANGMFESTIVSVTPKLP